MASFGKLLMLMFAAAVLGATSAQRLAHNCALHRKDALNRELAAQQSPGAAIANTVQFIPVCDASGVDYLPKQCIGNGDDQICACSTAEGMMLTGWEKTLDGCNCIRAQEKARRAGSFSLDCKSPGRFVELQCDKDSGRCWRVDPETGTTLTNTIDVERSNPPPIFDEVNTRPRIGPLTKEREFGDYVDDQRNNDFQPVSGKKNRRVRPSPPQDSASDRNIADYSPRPVRNAKSPMTARRIRRQGKNSLDTAPTNDGTDEYWNESQSRDSKPVPVRGYRRPQLDQLEPALTDNYSDYEESNEIGRASERTRDRPSALDASDVPVTNGDSSDYWLDQRNGDRRPTLANENGSPRVDSPETSLNNEYNSADNWDYPRDDESSEKDAAERQKQPQRASRRYRRRPASTSSNVEESPADRSRNTRRTSTPRETSSVQKRNRSNVGGAKPNKATRSARDGWASARDTHVDQKKRADRERSNLNKKSGATAELRPTRSVFDRNSSERTSSNKGGDKSLGDGLSSDESADVTPSDLEDLTESSDDYGGDLDPVEQTAAQVE